MLNHAAWVNNARSEKRVQRKVEEERDKRGAGAGRPPSAKKVSDPFIAGVNKRISEMTTNEYMAYYRQGLEEFM